MQKITVTAPANIAFIKYWGNTDDNLPLNSSISMTLDHCMTTTTAEHTDAQENSILIADDQDVFHELSTADIKGKKAYEQVERIRNMSGTKDFLKITTKNSFPSNTGIASSASGFAALTAAAVLAYGMNDFFEDKKELSKLVRQSGSGSAARSVYGGFVELLTGKNSEDAYAVQLADEKHWGLCDIVAIVNGSSKKISSSEGHRSARTSPYFETRLAEMDSRINLTREAIKEKDFEKLGIATERDTISMHMIMMSSQHPLYYWESGTIEVMKHVIAWREQEHIQIYFSIDAGANVHVICEEKNVDEIEIRLNALDSVIKTISNRPTTGVHTISDFTT